MKFNGQAVQAPFAYPNLPPPVTSGGFQTFIDATGKIWIAAPGVNGGNWKDPRDVLHAAWARNAVQNISTTFVAVGYDTLQHDPYSLYGSTSNGYIVPIAGQYLCQVEADGGSFVAGDYLALGFMRYTVGLAYEGFTSFGGTTGTDAHMSATITANAGDVIGVQARCNVVSGRNIFGGDLTRNWFQIDYLGSG